MIADQYHCFRVAAENDQGQSAYTSLPEPVLIKDPDHAPYLNISDLRDAKVRIGGALNLSIGYGGEPEPEIRWLKDGKVLRSSRMLSKAKDEVISFSLSTCERLDTGIYTVVVKNALGEAEASCNVQIVGEFSRIFLMLKT